MAFVRQDGTAQRIRAAIEADCARMGVPYPWWIPVFSTAAIAVIAIAAVLQRHALSPLSPIALGGLFALVPLLTWVSVRRMLLPPWVKCVIMTAATAVLLVHPTVPDFAPLLIVVSVAEAAAIYRVVVALAVTALGAGVLGVAEVFGTLNGLPLYLVALLLGLWVGISMRWQIRALHAERTARAVEHEQVALAERQRIAREVHDVVGHALSITMLHVSGARVALQQDSDIADAIDALIQAERIGRTAMADVRRSVGILSDTSAPNTTPLPGVDDVEALVARTRAAGLSVKYEQQGDLGAVSPSGGLGLYRIAQESLANIVKHAPSASASVRLAVHRDQVRLTVRNTLPTGTPARRHGGTGLDGMIARATQLGAKLTAGPDQGHWVIDLVAPLADTCPVRQALS
ncbi:MAG TPA: histidine kinase [Pseudonocardiaceae bacterium]|jgi:signal transduction histidine kinase